MRITKKHVFFWQGWLSNWYPAEIKYKADGNEITFHCSEQVFMYIKADTFKDYETAKEIVEKGSDPKEAKALGRKVKNYNDSQWNAIKEQAMYEACYEKFWQNKDLRDKLLDKKFDGLHFVEGSPYDTIWGIGEHFSSASDDESTWNGQNLLGKVLDRVRNDIKENLASGTKK